MGVFKKMTKKVKLRKINSRKYCLNCREIVEIKMEGLDGFCSECGKKVYSIDVRQKEK